MTYTFLTPRQTSKQFIGGHAYFYSVSLSTKKKLVSWARTNLLFTPFLHYLMIFLFIFSFNHRFKISFFDRLSRLNSFQVQVWMFSVKDLSNGFYIEFKPHSSTLKILDFNPWDRKKFKTLLENFMRGSNTSADQFY